MDELKVLQFADYMTVYITEPKNLTREFLKLINTFQELTGCNINLKKSVVFVYINGTVFRKKIRGKTPFTVSRNSKIDLSVTLTQSGGLKDNVFQRERHY